MTLMMMTMLPFSLQSVGVAVPSILIPMQQLPQSVKPRRARVPERPMVSIGTNPSSGTNPSEPTVSGKAISLFLDFDRETLTEYQCLLRQQIELFEAGPEEILANAHGRYSHILLGQVGIRCRHCANVPLVNRSRGFAYFSKSVDGLYQVAQNMSKHFCQTCRFIPPNVQNRLATLQQMNRRAAGGKEYWGEALRVLGVYEDGTVMRFRDSTLGEAISLNHTTGGGTDTREQGL